MNRKTDNSNDSCATLCPKLAFAEWYPVAGLILISEYLLLGLLAG